MKSVTKPEFSFEWNECDKLNPNRINSGKLSPFCSYFSEKAKKLLPPENNFSANEEKTHDSYLYNKVVHNELLSPEELEKTEYIINENFPLYSILTKLKTDTPYQYMIFSWVKSLNDSVSQSFCDEVLNRFKEHILKDYPGIEPVWNNYKNFLIKAENNSQFPSPKTLQIILEKSFQEAKVAHHFEDQSIDNPLKVISNESKINKDEHDEIIYQVALSRMELEREVLWIGHSIQDTINLERNLYNKYSENHSKMYSIDSNGEPKEVFENKDGILYKTSIFSNKVVTETFRIFNTHGLIDVSLLSMVRKNELPDDMPLYKELKSLIHSYIANWEFIPPFISDYKLPFWDVVHPEELEEYETCLEELKSWKNISNPEFFHKLFKQNYKGLLSKRAFYDNIDSPGRLAYIDIRDMWSMNIHDISYCLRKYHNDCAEIDRLDITDEQKQVHKHVFHKEMVLDSWKLMTEKFQSLVYKIQTYFQRLDPNIHGSMHIWWDEILLFIPDDASSVDIDAKELFNIFDTEAIKARIIKKDVQKSELGKWWEKIVSQTEKFNKFSKVLERRCLSIENDLNHNIRNMYFEDYSKIKPVQEAFKKIKHFSIQERQNKVYLHFPLEPFEGSNIIPLEDIISADGLLVPDSIFIQYLDRHNIWRIK